MIDSNARVPPPLLSGRNSLICERLVEKTQAGKAKGPSGKSQQTCGRLQTGAGEWYEIFRAPQLGSTACIIRCRTWPGSWHTGDVLSYCVRRWKQCINAAIFCALLEEQSITAVLLGSRLSFSLFLLTHSLWFTLLLLRLGPLSRHTPPPFLSVPPATSPHPLFSISVEFSM